MKMKMMLVMILMSVSLSAQVIPEVESFWNMVGQGYEYDNMQEIIALFGEDHEIVMLENVLQNVDKRDRVWKLVYNGAEFFFYEIFEKERYFLFGWIIKSEFVFPSPYSILFEWSPEQLIRRFGPGLKWQNDHILFYEYIPNGKIYFEYSNSRILERIYWSGESFH